MATRPLPPFREFLVHAARGLAAATALLGSGLGIGMVGYRYVVGLSWTDAFLNAAMLLSGEGPLAPTPTTAGKLFAGAYAIFGGIVFVTAAATALAPPVQRFLHRFHLEREVADGPPAGGPG